MNAARTHLDRDALAVSMRAYDHAIRLGHRYLGAEHFLLALAETDTPAGAVLREHGLTPSRVGAQLSRLAGAGLFGDLDRDALATAGIDVDAVRARIEASFGPQALSQANQAVRRAPAVSRWDPRRVRRASGAQRGGVFLPHGPGAEQALHTARQEAAARHAPEVSTGQLALALIAVPGGLVPPILAALGVSAPDLRTALLDRCAPPAPRG